MKYCDATRERFLPLTDTSPVTLAFRVGRVYLTPSVLERDKYITGYTSVSRPFWCRATTLRALSQRNTAVRRDHAVTSCPRSTRRSDHPSLAPHMFPYGTYFPTARGPPRIIGDSAQTVKLNVSMRGTRRMDDTTVFESSTALMASTSRRGKIFTPDEKGRACKRGLQVQGQR